MIDGTLFNAASEVTTAGFFDALFDDFADEHNRIAIWTPDLVGARHFGSPEKAAEYVQCIAPKVNVVYHGCALYREGRIQGRGKAADVTEIVSVWGDVDFGPLHAKNVPPDEKAAWRIIGRIGVKPSIVVHSGHGLHPYFLLKEPVPVEAAAMLLRKFGAMLQQLAGLDGYVLDSVFDVTRVLRTPGPNLLNRKDPNEERPVSVVKLTANLRYEIHEIEDACDDRTTDCPQEPIRLNAGDPRAHKPAPVESSRTTADRPSFEEQERQVIDAGGEFTIERSPDKELEGTLEALAADEPEWFGRTWACDNSRFGTGDSSCSGYLMSVADLLVDFDWNNQRIADAFMLFQQRWQRLRQVSRPVDKHGYQQTVRTLWMARFGKLRGHRPTKSAYHRSDDGNSRRLADGHGRQIRFCAELGWMAYNGMQWERDAATVHMTARAKETVRELFVEAEAVGEESERKKRFSFAIKSEGEPRIRAMIQLARAEPEIAVTHGAFDSDPWLLNVHNGTIDLRTRQLRPHDCGDLITKMAGTDYDESAKCTRWLEFLKRVTGGNQSLMDFMQRCVGYALTGVVSEHQLNILYGRGSNGKSTFVSTLVRMMGDYARMTPPKLLVRTHNERHLTELAMLWGLRFAASVESAPGAEFDIERVKHLTGGDQITANFMRKDHFSFWPTHKLFVAMNHLPVVKALDDLAFWRRIVIWPFDVNIPPEEADPELPSKLAEELPGILAWAVNGCNEWRARGQKVQPPGIVVESNARYRSRTDNFSAWLDASCTLDRDAKTQTDTLYKSYKQYCDDLDLAAMPDRSFRRALTIHGFEKGRTNASRHRIGIRLLDLDE